MEVLHIEDLSFAYPECDGLAVDSVNFSLNSGDFAVVCGASGCGKTTLLRLLKRELAPHGKMSGRIFYCGVLQDELDGMTSASEIGFVLQNPDSQIVTDKVWHELAFGLENLGLPTETVRRRVGEMASYFGIESWFRRSTDELSGGQKQLLNLAAVMVMQPKVLILDEPTSQLDPIAAADFIATLKRLNRELGLTVIIAEHRLEEVFPMADNVLVMDMGHLAVFDSPRNVGDRLRQIREDHPMLMGLPSAVRIFGALGADGDCPLTVREGRDFLEQRFVRGGAMPEHEYSHRDEVALEFKNVWFRYERDLPDILRGTSFKVYSGEIYCILGGNGTGKTTTLNVTAGLNKAYRGKVTVGGKPIGSYRGNSLYRNNLTLLPQDPQCVFIKDTVRADLSDILGYMGISADERKKRIDAVSARVGTSHLLDKNPLDLSGGEVQKCAIAKMLLLEPKILLLDEPTKGLDSASKQALRGILRELALGGMTVVIVTHDVEFAAQSSDRCALFFDGEILSSDVPTRFFSENNFYTTAANRMARNICRNAVTCEQVVGFCKGEGNR